MDFQWDELINLTYDMMFVIDNKGSIYFANQAATDNLYYTNEEFLSMNLSQILFESDKFIEVLELIISNSENQGAITYSYYYFKKVKTFIQCFL